MADDLAKLLQQAGLPATPIDPNYFRTPLQEPGAAAGARMEAYAEPWYRKLPNAATDAIYGPNANAQQASGVRHMIGPENPLNLPAQVAEGVDTAKQGYSLGSPQMMGMGMLQAAASLPSKGIFAGPMAKNANLAMMKQAESMAAAGKPREAIWRDTGWFQGPDKKWRYEISDHANYLTGEGATYHPGALKQDILDQGGSRESIAANGYQGKLSDVLQHKEAYDAYPHLANTGWASIPQAKLGPNTNGVWFGDPIGMSLSDLVAPSLTRGRSTTLHELQHGIQDAEGFAKGANSKAFNRSPEEMDGGRRQLNEFASAEAIRSYADARGMSVPDAAKALMAEQEGWAPSGRAVEFAEMHPVEKLQEMQTKVRNMLRDYEQPWNAYHTTAGEVEARAVQKRMDLTPEQRAARPPWLDFDVPMADQRVRMQPSGPAMSAAPPPGIRAYHGSPLEVRPMSNTALHDIGRSNFDTPYVLDPVANVQRSTLQGGYHWPERVAPLADDIKRNGWIEPLVVDRHGNVIEGQHRLRALEKLGIDSVPVHRLRELGEPSQIEAMTSAAKAAGVHREQASTIAGQIAKIIDAEGLSALDEYAAPRGFEAAWNAAIARAKAPPLHDFLQGKGSK